MTKAVYKIFDIGLDNDTGRAYPKTLFHGVQGCRRLPIGKWVKADNKMVTDGSGQARYLSGFHAYKSLEEVRAWIAGAKNLSDRVVVEVKLRKRRTKPHAVRETILADWLYVSPEAWEKRLPTCVFKNY